MFDLVFKVHTLQKQLIARTEQLAEKDAVIEVRKVFDQGVRSVESLGDQMA